jgi:hypothetical protein
MRRRHGSVPDPPAARPGDADEERRYSEGQEVPGPRETDEEAAERKRIGNFASREAFSDEIGPQGEPAAHDDRPGHPRHRADHERGARPGSVAGDALADDEETTLRGDVDPSDRPGRLRGDLTAGLTDVVVGPGYDHTDRHVSGDDQENLPEQERHRRFSEGQEYEGESSEKERRRATSRAASARTTTTPESTSVGGR